MGRPKKQKIEINDNQSLESMMQEVYNNACENIKDAQKVINEVGAAAIPTDIDDITKLAKSKTDALKIKDSAIKQKFDVGKLQFEIIKYGGNIIDAVSTNPDVIPEDATFDKIREMVKRKKEDERE